MIKIKLPMYNYYRNETLFISELLESDPRFKKLAKRLRKLCDKVSVELATLKGTEDIWCRDYMPIAIEPGRYIRFNYNPPYLKDEKESRTNSDFTFFETETGKSKFSSIKLEGGNVLRKGDRCLISSRVFSDNPEYEKPNKLINELENLLETEIIIIPEIYGDVTGHVDGMMQWVDEDTLIGNHRQFESEGWVRELNRVLRHHQLHYIDLPYEEVSNPKYPDSAVGCYINFIKLTSGVLLLPVYGLSMDEEVMIIMEQAFPGAVIHPIRMNEVAIYGGSIHCITWDACQRVKENLDIDSVDDDKLGWPEFEMPF